MPRNFTQVSPALWRSRRFQRLSIQARLLFLYYLTGPHQTSAGVFAMPDGYACHDVGLTPEEYTELRGELISAGMIDIDAETDEIMITGWFQHNLPTNSKWRTGTERIIEKVKSDRLRGSLENELRQAQAAYDQRQSKERTQRFGALETKAGPSETSAKAHR